MDRFQSTTTLGNGVSKTQSVVSGDRELREAEARVREQEAHVLRLIVQGAPTQMAEDLLRQLTATAEAVRQRLAQGWPAGSRPSTPPCEPAPGTTEASQLTPQLRASGTQAESN